MIPPLIPPMTPRILLICGLLLTPTITHAQQPTPAQPAPAKGVEISPEIFRMDSVGLTMRLPDGAIAQSNRMADQMAVQITPPPPDSTWLISIQTPVSKNERLTPEEVAQQVLDQLLGSVGVVDRQITGDGKVIERVVSTKGTIVEPVKAFDIANADPDARRPGARFYVRIPRGEKEDAMVRGYTIFAIAPGRFVAFDLATTEPVFANARLAYETTVGTARFADPAALAASRGAAVEAGIDFISKLTPAHYDAAVASLADQYYRMYKPAPGGSDSDATELAYRRIRAYRGMRGEIDPQAVRSAFKGVESQQGYIVRIDARYLQGQTVVDSVGVYFMTPDRKEEAWLLQMAIREPGKKNPGVWREAGARDALSMSVSISGTGMEDQVWRPVVPEAGYITMVESFLIPQLLINSQAAPGERGFYLYQSRHNKIRLRRDTLTAIADRPGAWRLTTRPSEDEEPQHGLYNERGDITQLSFQDGTQVVPTTLQRLMELWRNKNLPVD